MTACIAHAKTYVFLIFSVGRPPRPPLKFQSLSSQNFLKKELKKLNSKKRCRFKKFPKMGTSRPINGREAWGRTPPAHPTAGGESSRIRNFSYLRRCPSRGSKGIPPAQRAGCALFLIFCSNLYFINYLKFVLFSNTRFIHHTLLYTYKILVQFTKKITVFKTRTKMVKR
jgi:hypothetical protein